MRRNPVEAYDRLMGFCHKHMPDRFALDGDEAVSLRDAIVREVVVNYLIHREFTSPFPARIVIDGKTLHTENASKAMFSGPITPTSFSPLPKNPIIASFFSTIGLAEELGSCTRNLFKCSPRYPGRQPELIEGTVFTASVPIYRPEGHPNVPPQTARPVSNVSEEIARLIRERGSLTASEAVEAGYPRRTAQRAFAKLVREGTIVPVGNGRSRRYIPAK